MAIKAANDKSMSNITALPSGVSAKSMILISTQTASTSSTISFTSGIDSTYNEYVFKFINIHSSGNNTDAKFLFNGSIDAGSNYNVTKTSTHFSAYFGEDGSDAELAYRTNDDFAQSTAFLNLTANGNNDNDGNMGGWLKLFNPSSTTFVKHFIALTNTMHAQPANQNVYVGGYFNTTSDIDAVQFKFAAGTVDSGTIKMYGVV